MQIVAIVYTTVLFKVIGTVIKSFMIGFELTIKEQKILAALDQGVLSIIVTKVINEVIDSIEIDFTGLNTNPKNEMIDWYKANLSVGDELIIKIKEINENSEPIAIREQNIELINEQNLKAYYSLKKDLEDKGLI